MGILLKLKPRLNKRNGQINLAIPKKKIPESLRRALKHKTSDIRFLKFKFQGVDLYD